MVGTRQPRCLLRQRTRGVVPHHDEPTEEQNHSASSPHGLDDRRLSSRRGSISLDIPFYRTRLSVTGNPPSEPESQLPISRLIGSWEAASAKSSAIPRRARNHLLGRYAFCVPPKSDRHKSRRHVPKSPDH